MRQKKGSIRCLAHSHSVHTGDPLVHQRMRFFLCSGHLKSTLDKKVKIPNYFFVIQCLIICENGAKERGTDHVLLWINRSISRVLFLGEITL